jgi:Spy/CpxP family protein refolding chaperone
MRLHSSRRLILFCGLMSVALLASTAMAQQRARRPNTQPNTLGGLTEGRIMKNRASEIGLSEEDVAKIDAAMKAVKAEEEKLRGQSRAAFEKLNEVLAQNLPSEKELMAAANKVEENTSKSRVLKMKSVLQMRSLLTPEQLEKFMEIRKKATARR